MVFLSQAHETALRPLLLPVQDGVGGAGGGVGDTQALAHAADELNCPLLPATCLHWIDGNKQSYVVEGGNGGTGLHNCSTHWLHI
jgi:hypothetical protein